MFRMLKKELLDTSIIMMMLIYVLFQTWAHIALRLSEYIILMLIFVRLILETKIVIRKQSYFFLFFASILLGILVLNITTSQGVYITETINSFMLPTITVLYFIFMARNNIDFIKKITLHLVLPMNIYLFFNSIVMLIQTTGNYFLMDTKTANTFYPDLITGFLGADGTHRVTMFTICVLLINYINFRVLESKKRLLVCILFVVSMIISLYVSTQNDNNTFFLFLPLFIIMAYCIRHQISIRIILKKIWKYSFLIFIGLLLFVVLSKTELYGYLFVRVQKVVQTLFANSTIKEYQSDERALLLMFAIENGGMWGKGLGTIQMFADKSITTFFGTHFGMASVQNLVYYFGFIPYLLILLVVSMGFENNGKTKNIIIYFVLLFIISYYTQIFTTFGLTVLLCIAISCLAVISTMTDMNNNIKKEKDCI